MRNPQATLQQSVSVVTQDRRRGSRATLAFPIEVSGFDRLGRFHTEHTTTSDVSLMGCSFHLNMEVEKGLILALSVVPPKGACENKLRPVLFQIVRAEPRPGGYFVGALRLQRENPWIDYVDGADDTEAPPG
jgi:hypothetical protein